MSLRNIGSSTTVDGLMLSAHQRTHVALVLVSAVVEKVTSPFPCRSNTAVIRPSFISAVCSPSRTLDSPTSFASLTTFSPQHFFACRLRLPVEEWSFVSRYRRTIRDLLRHSRLNPVHWLHVKKCVSMRGPPLRQALLCARVSFFTLEPGCDGVGVGGCVISTSESSDSTRARFEDCFERF